MAVTIAKGLRISDPLGLVLATGIVLAVVGVTV